MFINMFYFPSVFPLFFPSVLREIIPLGIFQKSRGNFNFDVKFLTNCKTFYHEDIEISQHVPLLCFKVVLTSLDQFKGM